MPCVRGKMKSNVNLIDVTGEYNIENGREVMVKKIMTK